MRRLWPLMRPQRNDGGLGGRNLVVTTARHSWRRPYLGIGSDVAPYDAFLSPGLVSGLFFALGTPGSEPNSRVRIGIAGAVIGTDTLSIHRAFVAYLAPLR